MAQNVLSLEPDTRFRIREVTGSGRNRAITTSALMVKGHGDIAKFTDGRGVSRTKKLVGNEEFVLEDGPEIQPMRMLKPQFA